ncbi:MAG: sugar transferase [Candidatus Velthaea sp.]|jgi:lipopolysaccharide/colanic/teichoic acid biosynthesis glycosyltransferase
MSSLAGDIVGSAIPTPADVAASVASRSAGHATSIVFPYGLIFREDLRYARLRRAFDIAAAAAALVALSPVILAASVAIVAEDGGPIFFCQRRVGRFGRLFIMYKLRTMRKEKCIDGLAPSSRLDPRVTRIGHWLRRFSIDEIPQLVNVIRGDMAFVGPRPEMPFVVRKYEDWQNLRHLVTPGITGLWQATCRKTVPLHSPEATLLDLDYIRRASHLTDALMIVKTISALVSSEGAY